MAAPCANPNHVPTWGNREETLIHVAPKAQVPGGKIAILGGIPVGHIDDISGNTPAMLAQGIAVFITRVQTLSSLNAIVIQTEIGEGVIVIREAA